MDSQTVYQRINDVIGNDYTQLSQCEELMKSFNKEKNEIEFMLKTIQNEIPLKIQEILLEIEKLHSCISDLNEELRNFMDVYDNGEVEDAFEKLSELAAKKRDHSKKLHYYKTVQFIENSKFDLRKCYAENSWSQCASIYLSLCSLLHHIFNTECLNFKKYLIDIIQHWHKLLKEKLTAEYEQLMKIIDWPFVVRNKVVPLYPSDEYKERFQQLSKLLLEVELPEEMRKKPVIISSLMADFPTPSLPIFLLLEPLRKRFIYHFCGTRQTNRPDKPEWMFSQVLTWIKDHELFLMKWLQPVYQGFSISVKVQFVTNLVKMVTKKLHDDLMHLQYDDALFTHILDETLAFHREITANYGYPMSCPSVFSVLTQAQIFIKWIYVEKKCAEKRLDDIVNSSTAWAIINEDEKCKVTECGDKFIILLSSITERYSSLPQPGHRLQFLDFQLDLIDDFRLRLAQLKRDDFGDIFSSDLPAILNTVHYVKTVLLEWASDVYFLMLHHYKTQLSEQSPEDSSVFSDVLGVMSHFSDELTNEICTSVMLEISAKSRAYRKDRWIAMPPMDSNTELSLTISGCAMFQVLSSKLHELHNVLAPEIFTTCWRYIADQLSKLIINDVILVNTFSKGGAQQIKFDVTRNILPLFAQFTSKPEAYFKPLIEACELLCLEPTPAFDQIPIKVMSLKLQQVESILSRKFNRASLATYS